MKDTIVSVLMVMSLFLIGGDVYAQSDTGRVFFDCPDVPSSQFQFDLDRDVIALVMEDPTANIAPLFKSVDNLYLRNYRNRSGNFKKMVEHYSAELKARGWNMLGWNAQKTAEKTDLYLYILHETETVRGIFVIVKDKGGIYLINIVCEMPRQQLGDLLLNLDQLGIEIPRLLSLKPRDLELTVPPPPPPSEPRKPDPDPPTIEKREVPESITQETPEPPIWDWFVDGGRIHEVQIQIKLTSREGTAPKSIEETIAAEKDTILKFLRNGSGELREVIPVLSGALGDSRNVSLSVVEANEKRIAIISVVSMQKISVLKSMNISRKRVEVSVEDTWSISQEDAVDTPLTATRFWARDVPIHEVRIRGNRKVPEAQIRQTLDNASSDMDQALRTLFKVMPHFEEVRLQVDETDAKYIATITVNEKPLSTDAYLGLNPPMHLGFNRVTGWEIGTGFEVGKRKEVGPLWMWSIRNSQRDQISRLFGKVNYAFGNPHIHYRLGGIANWGKLYTWNLRITGQLHRLTDAIAPELFPNYNSTGPDVYRIFGGPDYLNYYLRKGVEVALQWKPVMPTHAFTLAIVAESHDSLQKSTDWSIANWRSHRKVRENPPINPGGMRSISFRYDFDTRAGAFGWHNTFFIEHSNPSFGSDFDFTRYQLHLRYAYPLGKHRIRTRLLLGYANTNLPIQRQFAITGPGGLRGYPLFAPANAAEKEDANWRKHSRYAFAGDRGFLFNIEYHYCLGAIIDRDFFNSVFVVGFLDEGQVWSASDAKYTFDPSGNVGIGLQLGRNDVIWRINVARALNFNTYAKERRLAEPGYVVSSVWYHVF